MKELCIVQFMTKTFPMVQLSRLSFSGLKLSEHDWGAEEECCCCCCCVLR